jgi:hypothetical protein
LKSPADYFKPPIQSTGLQILIIERQCTNVFIKIDRIPEAFFRLFHAARNARITGKVENDHGRTAAHFDLAMRSKTPKRTSLESFAGGPMKPDRDSGGTRPALALCPGKIGSAGNEGSAINVYFSHLEAMRADGQQPEQSPSHFLWTSIKYESKYVMSQKVVRSPRANSPYEIAC